MTPGAGVSTPEIEAAGQQELLNWACLLGAMAELDRKPEVLDYVETHVFQLQQVHGHISALAAPRGSSRNITSAFHRPEPSTRPRTYSTLAYRTPLGILGHLRAVAVAVGWASWDSRPISRNRTSQYLAKQSSPLGRTAMRVASLQTRSRPRRSPAPRTEAPASLGSKSGPAILAGCRWGRRSKARAR